LKPVGPIPPHFSRSDDGHLLIGGYRAEELVAEAGGTPLFVYDKTSSVRRSLASKAP